MKNRWIFTGLTLVMAGWLAGCAPTTRLASSEAVDDLYTSHNRRAIAEAEYRQTEVQRQREEQRALRDIESAGQQYNYQNILSDSYEESYERRLKGFESPTYKMPGSYYDYYYSDKAWAASAYDPAFYNVIVMGDQVWVEPRYITSMFGTWGTSVNVNIGMGWNSWYRPYWGWNYSPYWGSSLSWGWGYDPWYWNYPSWGWGGYYGHHHHWGNGHWGSGSYYRNNSYTSSTNRRAGTMGNYSSTPGRYSNGSSIARSSSGSYRRGSDSSYGSGTGSSTGYRRGGSTAGTTNSTGSSSTSYRRGSSTGTGSANTGTSTGTSGSSYRRGSSSSNSANNSETNTSNSGTSYRRGSESNSSNSSNSSYRNSGSSYNSGSSSSRSSGTSSAPSRSGGTSSAPSRSGGGRR